LLQIVSVFVLSLFNGWINWFSLFAGIIIGLLLFIGLNFVDPLLPVFPGIVAFFVNCITISSVEIFRRCYYKTKSYKFIYPPEDLPQLEPWRFKWCIVVYVVLGILSVPWFFPRTSSISTILGLPLWTVITLVITLTMGFFGFIVLKFYWVVKSQTYLPVEDDPYLSTEVSLVEPEQSDDEEYN